jgi:3-hydroxyisobutyrate dehydrogenase-like beta-hydroxyacid dehydrogenase
MSRVAVIGLGAMGSRIAGRLLDAGHEVVVWNRDAAKAEPLAAAGAAQAASPADAAGRAEAVITMVADPAALRAVAEGPAGALAGMAAGSTLVQMSTVGPAATAALVTAVPERIDLLDAPVLGSLSEAGAGALTVFAGGPAEVVDRVRPLLTSLGTVLHVGEVGAGSAAKLVANASLLGVLGLLAEALALAQGLGLAQATAFEVLARTPLGPQAERRRPAIETGDYPLRFTLALARKDADLILGAAEDAGAELRLLAATRSWFADAEAASRADDDYASVVAHILGETPPRR